MKWANIVRRWTVKSLHAAILGSALLGGAGLLGFASIASAQLPPGSKLPGVNYTRSHTFDLPVVMDAADRANVAEIRLYMKTPSAGWTLLERAPANLERFGCKVAQDGEYWYSLALVYKTGQMSPPDVNMEPPSQRVIVDTTMPVIDVQPWNADGDFCLRCTVQDANPDHATLKAVCRTDKGDLALEMVPNQPGVFRVRGAEMMQFPVVVSVMDMARNTASKEVNLREMIGTTLKAAPPAGGQISQAGVIPDPQKLTSIPPPLPKDGARTPGQITKFDVPPPPPPMHPPTIPDAPPPRFGTDLPTKQSLPVHLINTTHANVDFRIDQVGPSGVGKVEIYMTPDNGQTWHRLAEAKDKRSPTEIDLPGDGAYGIRIVVSNGNGFGGKAPVRGDAPQYTIEVDTTAPFVQLRSTEVLPSAGQVEIRWNAHDKNLGADAVSLYYRTRPDGPWQVIAAGVKNDGVHRWAFPRDAGGQFYFKVEVTDRAGNKSVAASTQATVIDMTEPRVTVVGVTGAGAGRP
ncbi:MAG: hypothetical protein HY289_00645 [Planctomycetes bacterium]|nr:hypothetical protein [Planctomycetota bacterium]